MSPLYRPVFYVGQAHTDTEPAPDARTRYFLAILSLLWVVSRGFAANNVCYPTIYIFGKKLGGLCCTTSPGHSIIAHGGSHAQDNQAAALLHAHRRAAYRLLGRKNGRLRHIGIHRRIYRDGLREDVFLLRSRGGYRPGDLCGEILRHILRPRRYAGFGERYNRAGRERCVQLYGRLPDEGLRRVFQRFYA